MDRPVRLRPRQQQEAAGWKLLQAERGVWVQHKWSCSAGWSCQPSPSPPSPPSLSNSLFCRAGIVRWRIWRRIASPLTPRVVLSTSLGEIFFVTLSMIDPRSGISTGTVGHYTQVVWATSSRLGCGRRGRYVVCNYLGGNMIGSSIYKRVIQHIRLEISSSEISMRSSPPGWSLLRLPRRNNMCRRPLQGGGSSIEGIFFKTITQRMHIAHLNLFAYSLCREAASWKLNNFESSVDWFYRLLIRFEIHKKILEFAWEV